MLAELLLLADDLPESGKLAAALSETFLLPDGSAPVPDRRDRTSVFADLYRRLALAQLNNQVRNKVAAALVGCEVRALRPAGARLARARRVRHARRPRTDCRTWPDGLGISRGPGGS